MEFFQLLDRYFPERVFQLVRVRVHKAALGKVALALGHYHRKRFPLPSRGEFEYDFFVSLRELGEFFDCLSELREKLYGYVGPPAVPEGLFTLGEALAFLPPGGELPQLCE